jgi:hypothetical protein
MKLFLFSELHRACNAVMWCIQRAEHACQAVRMWAWVGASNANLKACNERIVNRARCW